MVLAAAVGVYVWSGSGGPAHFIAASMAISMGTAGIAGAAMPILRTVSGQDPARSSSIVLTTITGAAGFFGLLGIATLLAGTI